jgi:hypothetical protein
MEMSWLDTVRLIGLDIQAGLIVALLVLHAVEQALARAWPTARRQVRPATDRYPDMLGAAKLGV